MKRVSYILLCVIMIFLLVGCNQDKYASSLKSGHYYAQNLNTENRIPTLHLDTESNTFYLCSDIAISYADVGTFEVNGKKLTAKSQNGTYQFRIINDSTFKLIDNGNNEDYPNGLLFVFSED